MTEQNPGSVRGDDQALRSRRSSHVETTGTPAATRSRARVSAKRRAPLRSLAVYGVIGALLLAVALPAYGAWRPAAQARTIQQVASGDAQDMVVASGATHAPVSRDSYSATTGTSLAKAKAEAAAAARAKAAAAAQAANARAAARSSASSSTSSVSSAPKVATMSAGSGTYRWPLTHVSHVGDGFHTRGGEHEGIDLLDPARTPIYAAADGVVTASSESYYGYGVGVVVQSSHNMATVYGHMTYGSRAVQTGQHVKAGQLIGLVGSTGHSTANHLHFEVHMSGTPIDPYQWLLTNVGPVP